MIRALAICFCALGGMASQAQVASQSVIVAMSAQRMENANGNQFAVDWTTSRKATTVALGVGRTDVASSHWTLLKTAAARTLTRGVVLAANLDHGPASIDGVSTRFTRFRSAASIPLRPRWALQVTDRFVDVESVSGHSLGAGARFDREDLSFALDVTDSISGTLDQQSLSFRFDYRGAPPYFMGGLSVGRSNNRLVLKTTFTEPVTTDLREAFAGLATPIGSTELLLVLAAARTGDARRLSLSAVLRLPIGTRDVP